MASVNPKVKDLDILFDKIVEIYLRDLNATKAQLEDVSRQYYELQQRHAQLQQNYDNLRADPVLSFIHKLYDQRDPSTADIPIAPPVVAPLKGPATQISVVVPPVVAVKSPILIPKPKSPVIVPPTVKIAPSISKPSVVYVPPSSNSVSIPTSVPAPNKFSEQQHIAPNIITAVGTKAKPDQTSQVKKKVGRPKKVVGEQSSSEEDSNVQKKGPGRPKKIPEASGNETVVKKAPGRPKKSIDDDMDMDPTLHIAKLAQGDFTLGRKVFDDDWYDNKDDLFISATTANLYNNLMGRTNNKMVNRENGIDNFILGYNYVRNHSDYGYLLNKKYQRLLPHPKGEVNVEYVKDDDILKPLGLELDGDGFVQRINQDDDSV
jgi:hypothetical protein